MTMTAEKSTLMFPIPFRQSFSQGKKDIKYMSGTYKANKKNENTCVSLNRGEELPLSVKYVYFSNGKSHKLEQVAAFTYTKCTPFK